MRSHIQSRLVGGAMVLFASVLPGAASAQVVDDSIRAERFTAEEEPVVKLDYSGPRFGMTWDPSGGAPVSQFGWHFEKQTSSGRSGPSFVFETVLLAGGIEDDRVIPNATFIFGVRLPNGGELGVGPSFTVSPNGASSAIVVACGQSFKVGGIRVPMNFAVSLDREGQRMSLLTGWAIRDR